MREYKRDCPHMTSGPDGGLDNEMQLLAYGDPLDGGDLWCPFCRAFTGTWSTSMTKTKEERATPEETAEFVEQLDILRLAMARAMLVKFSEANISELVNYIDYTMTQQAETGFNMEQWLVHQLSDDYSEWKSE